MLSATLYRYLVTLRRNPVDTISMFIRPGVSALLFSIFALFYLSGSEGVGYLCVSLAIVNLITNSVIGAGFEGREDGRDERIDSVILAPGGLCTFCWSHGLVQTIIAFTESAVVLIGVAVFLPNIMTLSLANCAWSSIGLFLLIMISISWGALAAWAAVRINIFLQMNFVTMLTVTLSGSFWPVTMLLEPFKTITRCNPLTYAIDLVRAPLTNSPPLVDPVVELIISLALAAVLAILVLIITRKKGDLSERVRM